MITIEVHNLFSKQAEDVRVYNDFPEKERDAIDKMVLAKGKSKILQYAHFLCRLAKSV